MSFNYTPANRVAVPASRSAPDPGVRGVINHVTSNIDLVDDAEYDLGGMPESGAQFEVRYISRERPVVARARVMAKAAVAFSASAISSNVLTLTVAAGASEGIQVDQWLQVQLTTPSLDANATLDGSWVKVTATTSTTIVCAFTATDEAACGAGTAEAKALVFGEEGPGVTLWDSVIAADNQEEIIGTLRPGKYVVQMLDTSCKAGVFYSDGTVIDEIFQHIDEATDSNAFTNATMVDATSNTLTALFVSSGNVALRNGADIAAKIRVTYYPLELTGLDQDGAMCVYSKGSARDAAATLRLRNRTGGTINDIQLSRVH